MVQRAHIIASEQLVYLSDCSIDGLIVSEHWMHFAELITLRHPIPPPTKLASAQGGRGSQTRNCIGVTLCTSSSPSSTSSNSSTCTSSCIVLHCRLPCNFPAPTCNSPLVGSYENWKTEYQLLDQNACYLKAKTKWQNSLEVDTLYYSWWGMTCHVGWWILIFVWVSH